MTRRGPDVRVGELLDQVRQYYLDRFIKTRDELLAEQNTRLLLEPELRGSDGAVVTEGTLQLPLRMDIAVIKDGSAKTLSIDTERMLSFEAFQPPTILSVGDGARDRNSRAQREQPGER